MSYTQIKEKLGISKGTLSGWLHDMPLSRERISELRDNSEQRIEKYRETMCNKKESRRALVFQKVARDIEQSKDSSFVAGFYLYWGEGTKTAEYSVSLTNSDPAIVNCFVSWLENQGVQRYQLRVKLHAYSDQDELQLKKIWSTALNVPLQNFNKTYIKTTRADRKTYKGMFPYGTCVVTYHNRDMYEYVLEGIKYLQGKYKIAASSGMG